MNGTSIFANRDTVLLVPDYEEDAETYPGDIKPGCYSHQEVIDLLRTHSNNPEAVRFLADMLEL